MIKWIYIYFSRAWAGNSGPPGGLKGLKGLNHLILLILLIPQKALED